MPTTYPNHEEWGPARMTVWINRPKPESETMAGPKNNQGQNPLRIETVRGEPYTIGGRSLTPVMRVVSYGRARATIGTRRLEGWAGGLVRITPLAIVEETPGGERRIAIHDATRTALGRILAITVAATLFFSAIRWVVRQRRSGR